MPTYIHSKSLLIRKHIAHGILYSVKSIILSETSTFAQCVWLIPQTWSSAYAREKNTCEYERATIFFQRSFLSSLFVVNLIVWLFFNHIFSISALGIEGTSLIHEWLKLEPSIPVLWNKLFERFVFWFLSLFVRIWALGEAYQLCRSIQSRQLRKPLGTYHRF